MFIKTFKVKKPTVFGVAVIIAVICLLVAVGLTAYRFTRPTIYEMKTEKQRQEFISEMGWEVPDEFDECKATVIPEEWNDVYDNYNNLQKEQGFDLSKFKGKTVDIYTYKVKNYPNYEDSDCIKCTLIVYDGQLIGGDVCSVELDGFMQGLRKN